MKCPQCGAVIPTIDDTFIQIIATPREFEAWQMRKRKMKVEHIAEDMGITRRHATRLRQTLLKKIKKFSL